MTNKVVLIRPPGVMKGTSFIASQFPLNLASIAANLIQSGFDPEIWDYDVEHYDAPAFKRRVMEARPIIVGISCYTPTVINAHALASAAKEAIEGVQVVAGGPHVSALPGRSLDEFPAFDACFMGEGEVGFAEIAKRAAGHESIDDVTGVVSRTNLQRGGHIRAQVDDLDSLPHPARHLLKRELYKGQSHRGFSRDFLRITEIMTSRGCPNRCIFCASDVVSGRGVRFRSVSSVASEIRDCVDRFGFNHFTISDDTFTLKEDRLAGICDELRRQKVTWNCNARVWPLSKQMLEMMAGSGCKGITFGVESGSPRILKLIKKNITPEQVIDAFRWSKEAGIKYLEADVIIGSHPEETAADVEMTKQLLLSIDPDIIMASVVVPYPGTELYKIMREQGLIAKEASWDSFVLYGKVPAWRTRNFDQKKLLSVQKEILMSFYLRPSHIAHMFMKIRDPREMLYLIRGGIDFVRSALAGSA